MVLFYFESIISVHLKGKAAGTKHRSQVTVLPIQKLSQTPLKANLRPKQKFVGPKVSF